MKRYFYLLAFTFSFLLAAGQKSSNFNGLDMNLGNLFRLSDAKTRSISPENPTGEPGKGGMATLKMATQKMRQEILDRDGK